MKPRNEIMKVFYDGRIERPIIWIILEYAGICASGRYSMFFWVYV
jgi:hypothetical protein